jgi:hypothetical protein
MIAVMRQLIAATLAAFALVLAPALPAQINGVASSVTSLGFGGHFNPAPGVPASVTSLGQRGLVPNGLFFNQRPSCFNSGFPISPNPPLFPHLQPQFFTGGVAVYPMPYAVQYAVPVAVDDTPEDDYSSGPAIFDRRGRGTANYSVDRYPERAPREQRAAADAPSEPVAQAAPEPVALIAQAAPAPFPKTLLVFKDGHQIEVSNYAIIGGTLYDLSEGHHRKIALSELNLTATTQQNDDRGIDFVLPPTSQEN